MTKEHNFSGTIVAPSVQGGECFVKLDQPVEDMKLAVVTFTTKGRIAVMNGRGRLMTGERVNGVGIKSVDALEAISIQVMADA